MADWPRHKDNCVPVVISEVGEKGRGLVAARDIKVGERILIDSVVISVESTKLSGVMTRKAVRSLKEQIQALAAEKASQFQNITFSERDLKTLRQEKCFNEMKIFLSNKIERCNYEDKEDWDVLFLVLSLINHSCAPNVEDSYLTGESEDQETVEEYELRAVRDISNQG